MLKKIISTFLVMTLVLTNFQGWEVLRQVDLFQKLNLFQGIGQSFAEKGTLLEGTGIYYTIVNNEVTITDCDANTSGSLLIPQSIEGYPVTNIKSYAFSDCEKLTSITISDSVKTIESSAFFSCDKLTSVTISNSVTSIKGSSFYACDVLNNINVDSENKYYCSVDGVLFSKDMSKIVRCPEKRDKYKIPNSVISIGSYAFYGCISLTSIEIPNSVTSIESYAFCCCYTLPNIEIPNSVISIEDEAFSVCRALVSIEIPNSVTSMGRSVFSGCPVLTNVKIPNSITSIESYTFCACDSLVSIEIPSSVTTIGSCAFYDCDSLANIEIPSSVTTIGSRAFYDCDSLTSIMIPSSVTLIEDRAFYGCELVTIYGYSGSYAETYAKNNNIPFIDLEYNYLKNFDSKSKYVICVKNTKGMPIKNAEVKFNSQSGKTNSQGWISFEKITVVEPLLVVSCDGYYTYRDISYDKKSSNIEIITLYNLSESEYKLDKAYYSPYNSDSKYIFETNLISGKKSINKGKIFKFGIQCSAINTEDVIRYELWQNNNYIKTSDDGNFLDLSVDDFEEGTGINVRVYYSENKYVITTLNLEILQDPGENEFSLQLGENFEMTVPEDVFLIGGQTLKLNLPELPVYFTCEDGVIRAGVNISKETVNDKGKFKNLKDLYSDFIKKNKDVYKSTQNGYFSETMKAIGVKQDKYDAEVPGIEQKVKVNIFGYGEGKVTSEGLSYVTLNVVLNIEYTAFDKTYYKVVPIGTFLVPVTSNLKAKLEGKAILEAGLNLEDRELQGDIKGNIRPSFKLYGGIGAGKVLSLGAYGNLALNTEVQLVSSINKLGPGVNKIDLEGEAGVKGYLLFNEMEYPLITKTANIFTRNNSGTMYSLRNIPENIDVYDESNYSEMDRSYLDKQSLWKGNTSENVKLRSASIEENNSVDILTNTYPAALPKIVSNGENTVMVFLQDDGTRNTYNMTKLMYSVYDKNNKSWGTPKQIDSNETADYNPYLYSDGQDIYVVYQDTLKAFENVEDLNEYTKQIKINVSKFDVSTNEFESVSTFETEENTYNSNPKIAVINSVPTVVWTSNINGDVFGCNNTNNILCSKYEEGKWTKPEILVEGLNSIVDLNIGEINNNLLLAYAVDLDNDLSTCDDISLYTKMLSTDSVKVSTGYITNLIFEKNPKTNSNDLMWYENENISYTSDGINKEDLFDSVLEGLNKDFKVVGNRIIYTKADVSGENGVSNIYSISYKDGQFESPIKITNSSNYIKDISVLELDGDLLCAYMKSDISITEDTVDESATLSWQKISTINNISLDFVNYENKDIAPEKTIPLKLDISNKGETTITQVLVEINDSEGNNIISNTLSTTIKPGESSNLSINFDIPATIENKDYNIEISIPEKEDLDLTDNNATFNIYQTDLEVSSEQVISENRNQVMINVTNNGVISTGSTLNIYKNYDETEPIYTKKIDSIDSGNNSTFILDLSDSFAEGEDISNIKIAVDSDVSDYNLGNNKSLESLTKPIKATFKDGQTVICEKFFIGDSSVDINDIEIPTKEGYKFLGWATEKDNKESIVDFKNHKITDNTVYYAIWETAIDLEKVNLSIKEGESLVEGKEVTLVVNKLDSSYQYKFLEKAGSKWTIIQNYSDKNEALYTPISAGTKTLYVDIKNTDTNEVTRKYLIVKVENKALEIESFTANPEKDQILGETVELNVKATGGSGDYEYKFIEKAGASWTIIQDYSDKNTALYTPTSIGSKTLYVDVKDKDTKTVIRNYITYKVNYSNVEVKLFSTKPEKYVTLGNQVELTALGEGGSGSYEYKFIEKDSNGNWTKIRDYENSNEVIYTPTSAGSKTLYVDIKDTVTKTVVRKGISFKVFESEFNVESFEADKESPYKLNDEITLTAKATGGSEKYQYKFLIKEGNIWTQLQSYSDKNTCNYVPTTEGSKTLYVDVKDTVTGIVIRKYLLIKVVE